MKYSDQNLGLDLSFFIGSHDISNFNSAEKSNSKLKLGSSEASLN